MRGLGVLLAGMAAGLTGEVASRAAPFAEAPMKIDRPTSKLRLTRKLIRPEQRYARQNAARIARRITRKAAR